MIEFVSVEDAERIHDILLREYGGCPGILTRDGLASALAQAEATWDGEYLHEDLATMAATYLYHIARGHPFVDGNKRTACGVALCFLLFNGYTLRGTPEVRSTYEALVLEIADSRVSREAAAEFFRQHMIADSE